MRSIDLTILTKNEVSMLTGHDRGLAARELYDLNALEQSEEKILLLAPLNLDTITSSFVQGFLSECFNKFGEDGLRRIYDFSQLSKGLKEDIDIGIERLKLHL